MLHIQNLQKRKKTKKPACERVKLTNTLSLNTFWGARGVMVIVVGIGHGDTSSNPGRDWLHFT